MPNKIPFVKSAFSGLGLSAQARERAKWYGQKRWKELRLAFLKAHPICARCQANGLIVVADTVHHVRERLKAPHLAFTWTNLESLCKSCHTFGHKHNETTSDISPTDLG